MNCTGKYLMVWKKQEQNGFIKLDLGDSKKMKDGTYQNWTWYGCTLVGNAKNLQVEERDKIEIVSGQISQREYNGKWYTDVTIFEANVMGGTAPKEETEKAFVAIDDLGDGLPF